MLVSFEKLTPPPPKWSDSKYGFSQDEAMWEKAYPDEPGYGIGWQCTVSGPAAKSNTPDE